MVLLIIFFYFIIILSEILSLNVTLLDTVNLSLIQGCMEMNENGILVNHLTSSKTGEFGSFLKGINTSDPLCMF